jgi:hypothetical protein
MKLSNIKLALSLTASTLILLSTTAAFAEESSVPASAPAPSAVSGAPSAGEQADVAQPPKGSLGKSVGLAFDNGLFGTSYEQGVRLRIPVLRHFALNLRGISTLGSIAGNETWRLGGRLEVIGHTPVYLNLVRIYGGGGPEVTTRLHGTSSEDKTLISGGGQVGFEFFAGRSVSFFAEIGGHGGDEATGGGTVLAGVMLYPFAGP